MKPSASETAPVSLYERRNRLVEAHLSLVAPIARHILRTLPRSFELDDLIGAGNLGLLEAAARYRVTDGTPFAVYARVVIRGYILMSVRRGEYVEATRPALADAPEPAGDNRIERGVLASEVRAKVRTLPRRQAEVLELHYGAAEMRLRLVGCRFGLDASRASRLHVDALKSLRNCLAV